MKIITNLPVGIMEVETSEAKVVSYVWKDRCYAGHLYRNKIVYPCKVTTRKEKHIYSGFTAAASPNKIFIKDMKTINNILFDKEKILMWDENGDLICGELK